MNIFRFVTVGMLFVSLFLLAGCGEETIDEEYATAEVSEEEETSLDFEAELAKIDSEYVRDLIRSNDKARAYFEENEEIRKRLQVARVEELSTVKIDNDGKIYFLATGEDVYNHVMKPEVKEQLDQLPEYIKAYIKGTVEIARRYQENEDFRTLLDKAVEVYDGNVHPNDIDMLSEASKGEVSFEGERPQIIRADQGIPVGEVVLHEGTVYTNKELLNVRETLYEKYDQKHIDYVVDKIKELEQGFVLPDGAEEEERERRKNDLSLYGYAKELSEGTNDRNLLHKAYDHSVKVHEAHQALLDYSEEYLPELYEYWSKPVVTGPIDVDAKDIESEYMQYVGHMRDLFVVRMVLQSEWEVKERP
ncbi:hypothetical protein GCM10010965_01540 [Caldalkalibacillus thermarum]|uniref:hypothetical protein n=1 Tax=Caldalkalibacillus thermarum TaxID=296745 RepID=UPI0016658982|nr:hypothetical protein [Caldalkalibacillus thermarum]GGK12241.1 hypothetical protein GCM10010965_01540 [Caldalkalibacillus thermarum]